MARKQSQASRIESAKEAMLWAIEHFEAMDQANAKMHCAPVRYSPITFRLVQAYDALHGDSVLDRPAAVSKVLGHVGDYEPDPGR